MGVRECPLKTDWALFGFRLSECKLQFVFALKTNSLRILLSLEYHNFSDIAERNQLITM